MRLRNVKGAYQKVGLDEKAIKNPEQYKGKWNTYFGNNHSIYIEIGMGKGQFIVEHARKNPNINYIGLEKFSVVLAKALEKLDSNEEINNLAFIRFDAENLLEIFEPGEIDRIYLNFSDPWPKERHAKRRLLSKTFLEKYAVILKEQSLIIFKTDNEKLFTFSNEQIQEFGFNITTYTEDLHNSPYLEGNIMTEYEKKFVAQGMNIFMLTAQVK